MSDFLTKTINEFQTLKEGVNKCRNFILDEQKLNSLDLINRDLLIAQLKAMETYLSILSIRIGINQPSTDQTIEQISEPVNLDTSVVEGD